MHADFPTTSNYNSGHTNCEIVSSSPIIWCVSVESEVQCVALKWRAEKRVKDPFCPCLESVRDHESELEISENKSYLEVELGPHMPDYWLSNWLCLCVCVCPCGKERWICWRCAVFPSEL